MKEFLITLAILTHDELNELKVLLPWLERFRECFDELVVVDDFSMPEVDDLLRAHDCKVFKRELARDFATQRNFAIDQCAGDFILFVDADEIPGRQLLLGLRDLAAQMRRENYDVCAIPRLNIVYDGDIFLDCTTMTFTDEDLKNQAADDQVRLLRKAPHIRYKYAVHEKVFGGRRGLRLPRRVELSLLHVKRRRRAESQDRLYLRLERLSPRAIARRLLGRLGLAGLAPALRSLFDTRWSDYRGDPYDV